MHDVSDPSGQFSSAVSLWEVNYTSESIEEIRKLAFKANTIPLIQIFRRYGIRLDEYNRKITCPFPNHSGGRENTPSLNFYPETNSFFCFGCKLGGQHSHSCEFVAAIEGISKKSAAEKIISIFDTSDIEIDYDVYDASEKLNLLIQFSNLVRNFRNSQFSPDAEIFIEDICKTYDSLYNKYNLSIDALKRVMLRLEEKIKQF